MTPLDVSLPYLDDAEKGVLSALFFSPNLASQAHAHLRDEYFHRPENLLLFQTIKTMVAEDRPIELPSVSSFCFDTGIMDKVGGPGGLADICNFIPTADTFDYYKDLLIQKAKQRSILKTCAEIHGQAACLGHEDPSDLISSAAERFFEISKNEQSQKETSWKEKLRAYIDNWEDRALGKKDTGIPMRWPSWNETFGGLTPRMWLVCAYPSEGKSALAQNIVEDVLAHGGDVLWFSYEMDETEIIDRMVSSMAKLESHKVFFPSQVKLQREDTKRITTAIADMDNFGLHLRCEPTWTIEQIVSETRAMKRKNANLKLVVCDYMQLVPTAGKYNSRSEQMAHVSRTFKRDVSGANGIAALMLSQLNDDGKTLDSRAPGQDASNVLFIESEAQVKDNRGQTKVTKAGLRVSKNRNGKRGHALPIRLNGECFTFEEYHPQVVRQ